jgi:hypothetical protein
VFGKKDNTDAIELSAIAAGTGGFVINGESAIKSSKPSPLTSPTLETECPLKSEFHLPRWGFLELK